jgi:hypothetical protein
MAVVVKNGSFSPWWSLSSLTVRTEKYSLVYILSPIKSHEFEPASFFVDQCHIQFDIHHKARKEYIMQVYALRFYFSKKIDLELYLAQLQSRIGM